jgi:hypothetical protein
VIDRTKAHLLIPSDRSGTKVMTDSLRRDLHSSTAAISSLLSSYAKLANSASTSYSSSGIISNDTTARKQESELELNSALDLVKHPSLSLPSSSLLRFPKKIQMLTPFRSGRSNK